MSVMTQFIEAFNDISERVLMNSLSKGFPAPSKTNFAEHIALMHGELSEALESWRGGSLPSDHIPEFTGEEEEFADEILRIMLVSRALGMRTAEALFAKMTFNSNRPYKHGGKKI
jgi:NTP pyrophosphatase (non-canonical NTP hydrolase)